MKITRQGYPGIAVSPTFQDRLLAARGRPEAPPRCSRCRRDARYFVLDWPSQVWLCPACSRPDDLADSEPPARRRALRSTLGSRNSIRNGQPGAP